jgi:hypothetical protein
MDRTRPGIEPGFFPILDSGDLILPPRAVILSAESEAESARRSTSRVFQKAHEGFTTMETQDTTDSSLNLIKTASRPTGRL